MFEENKELEEMFLNSEDSNQKIEVHQGSWRITSPTTPIIATKNLADCVGILVYDLDKEFAFLSHSDINSFTYRINKGDRRKDKSIHLQELIRKLESTQEDYHLKVIIFPGDYTEDDSITAIYNTLEQIQNSNITIESIEERKPFIDSIVPGTRSISFNSQTGELLPYRTSGKVRKERI